LSAISGICLFISAKALPLGTKAHRPPHNLSPGNLLEVPLFAGLVVRHDRFSLIGCWHQRRRRDAPQRRLSPSSPPPEKFLARSRNGPFPAPSPAISRPVARAACQGLPAGQPRNAARSVLYWRAREGTLSSLATIIISLPSSSSICDAPLDLRCTARSRRAAERARRVFVASLRQRRTLALRRSFVVVVAGSAVLPA
jgi:hypothetical protein